MEAETCRETYDYYSERNRFFFPLDGEGDGGGDVV